MTEYTVKTLPSGAIIRVPVQSYVEPAPTKSLEQRLDEQGELLELLLQMQLEKGGIL